MINWRRVIRSWMPLLGLNRHQRVLFGASIPFALIVVGVLLWTAAATTTWDRLSLLWKAGVVAGIGFLFVRQLHLHWLLYRSRREVRASRKAATDALTEVRIVRAEVADLRRKMADLLMGQAVDLMIQPPAPRRADSRPRSHLSVAPEPEE